MTIVQVNNRYYIEMGSRMHILTQTALVWNLKYVFKMKKPLIKKILDQLHLRGRAELAMEKVA